MLMTTERRLAIRTLRGWAISVLQEAGSIRECETQGWMQAAPIRTRASALSPSPATVGRPASSVRSADSTKGGVSPQMTGTAGLNDRTIATRSVAHASTAHGAP